MYKNENSKEKEDYLPLFLSCDDPIVVYVVDNKLVDFDIVGGTYHNSPKYSYYLLGKLATNPKTKDCIPRQILDQHLSYFKNVDVSWPCLSGILFEGCNRCLSVSMEIVNEENNCYALFKDFAYIDSHDGPFCFVSDLNSQFTLSPEDAFLLLANICAGTSFTLPISPENQPFNPEKVKKSINDRYEALYQKHVTGQLKKKYSLQQALDGLIEDRGINSLFHFYSTNIFQIDYLVYLKEELLTNRIPPEKLLQLSGANMLIFFSDIPKVKTFIDNCINRFLTEYTKLSFNEKVCYSTLILICAQDYETRFPELAQYSENHNYPVENQPVISILEKEFRKRLYRPSGKKTFHNNVYLKYLGRKFF